ncbi:AraC family transcriptional regulator [uncultured Mitsuokella sp.]|uniref:AraC family transcriptional regulator n=1 Tax=uncultured Mitsuokella sp. TaxID=453120 RepID=UPI00266FDB2F|nr:AraC family transcriptional regulator [uncultured Mitsuokella sp.]
MPIITFGSPKQSQFELGRRPYLESVENLNNATAFGTLHSHHDMAELLFIEKGHGRMLLKDGSVQLRTDDLVLINSDVLHDFKINMSFMAFTMHISSLQLCGLSLGQLTKAPQPFVLHLSQEGQHAFLRGLLKEIKLYAAFNDDSPERAEIAACLLQALILTTVKLTSEANEAGEDNASYNMGTRIKEYIDAHYLEDLKLPDIAEALHINLYYLSHTFKDLTGSSPMQYIIRRRIDEAQTLLLTTNMTITDIAMQCGYNNSNYFQSVFSNIVGMPPGKYRKTWSQ